MSVISEFFSRGWKFFVDQVKSIGFNDIIDILIVAVLFYYIYLFIRDRRAGKLAIGVAILVVMQIVSEALDLTVMKFILHNIFQIGVLAIIIILQPELRSMLERVGGDSLRGLRNLGTERDVQQIKQFKDELCDAVNELSMSRTGALIAIERSTRLGDVIASGTIINADVSSLLLRNIFFDKSPLHDGAVVIRDMRILSAGCMLPLASKTNGINKELGTRHRAAIGLSEQSDAVIIVVSEETGNVSVAYKGRLTRDYDVVNLRLRLDELIYPQQNSRKRKSKKNGKASGEAVENVKEDADDVQ